MEKIILCILGVSDRLILKAIRGSSLAMISIWRKENWRKTFQM
jgi:hypothetical protein